MRPVSLVRLDEATHGERIMDSDTADAIRGMLEEVVRPGGIGNNASIAGYRVAGKTGTAWKFAAGGYSEDKYFSIFAGLVPASDPRAATLPRRCSPMSCPNRCACLRFHPTPLRATAPPGAYRQ
jgi:cell division protein FtsI (penicillin-binding protein 3)